MGLYYNRVWSIEIDGQPFIDATTDRQFQMAFNVNREFGGSISYADIALYNLSQDTAQKVIKQGAKIVLKAGYVDNIATIFTGMIVNVLRERQNTETITRAICTGYAQERVKTVSKSFAKGTQVVDIIKSCIEAANLTPQINEADFEAYQPYSRGYTLSGDPLEYLAKLRDTHNFDYVIDGDICVVTGAQKFVLGATLMVSQETGMQGIPVVTHAGVEVKIRLTPQAQIGGKVEVLSKLATFNFNEAYFQKIPESAGKGVYKIMKVQHAGSSHGDEWTTSITAYR